MFQITTSVLVKYVPDKIEKRVRMIIGSAVACLAFLLIGPSVVLKFPDSLLLMGIGQAILGITYAMVMVPSLPEMIEGGHERFPTQESDVNCLCSGMFSSSLGIG